MASILIVDDEASLRRSIAISMRADGHTVAEVGSCGEALEVAARDVFDLAILDLRLPDGDGLSLLRALRERALTDAEAILLTAFGTLDTALEAVRAGAYDFLQKPFSPEVLSLSVARALEHRRLRGELRRRAGRPDAGGEALVGDGPAMRGVRQLIARAPEARVVLITGESGTGKDLVARAIHAAVGAPERPFVVVHCGALPESLVESELFGHVRGAFTGAERARQGLLAESDGGTIFLDEIAELPLPIQPRLLRFLQSGEVRAVGADHAGRVSCRVVAATHRDLAAEIARGRLREDLFYRLDVFHIHLPALRERPEDLASLAQHLLTRLATRLHRETPRLSPAALEALAAYSWPGNVRQLEHTLERALLLADDELSPELLVPSRAAPGASRPAQAREREPVATLAEVERLHILGTLERCQGDHRQLGALLGISRSTLRRKLIEYGVWSGRGRADEAPDQDEPSGSD